MLTKRDLLRSAALAAISVTATKSAPASAQTSARWPEVFEAKDIAEEGFIYGLPLVMNYAVMHEFAVDTKSSQFKAPFNEINNRAPRRYPGRHGGHHAEQRHTLLDALAGFARGADGDLGAGGRKEALLLGAAHRRQYLQLWLHRQPRHGDRARRLSRRRPRLERRERLRESRRSSHRRRRSRSPFSAPSSSIPKTCRTSRRSRPATRCSRFPRS